MSQMTMTTNKGEIVFEMFDDKAPKTVANFEKLVKEASTTASTSPRHPRLHDPDRLPQRHRHRRPRLLIRRRVHKT